MSSSNRCPPTGGYSYVFDGAAQALDHMFVFVTPGLLPFVSASGTCAATRTVADAARLAKPSKRGRELNR